MMDVELVPIGTLDRHNGIERNLDNLVQRAIYKRGIVDASAATFDQILDAYLAVVRRRNKCHRGWDRLSALQCEFAAITRLEKRKLLDPIEELAEQALHCAEAGNIDGVINALRRRLVEKQRLINEEQTRIARTLRNDPLRNCIYQVAKKIRKLHDHKCTFEELRSELQRMEGDGVIERVLTDSIMSRNPAYPRRPAKTTANGTIRNILTKANEKAL